MIPPELVCRELSFFVVWLHSNLQKPFRKESSREMQSLNGPGFVVIYHLTTMFSMINENKTLSIMIGQQYCHLSFNTTLSFIIWHQYCHLSFAINVVIYHLITIHCLIFSFTWLSVLKEHASRRWDGASRNWNFWFLRLLRRIPGFAPNATYWQQRVLKENYRLNICRRKPIGVQSINLELDWEQLWQFATTSESGIRMICYSTEVRTICFSGSSS